MTHKNKQKQKRITLKSYPFLSYKHLNFYRKLFTQ